MEIEGIGSSVVIALAAVLWLVYLIPTWFRRREYLSTERNAVRLQQTLRIMAESAEVPEAVHVETSARAVAAQQKLLRQQADRAKAIERARDAAMSRAAAQTLATLKPAVAAAMLTHSTAARRLRRSRAATTVVLLMALATVGFGVTPIGASVSMAAVVTGSIVAVASLSLLSTMASVARARARAARELRAQREAPRTIASPAPTYADDSATDVGWTPVPIPKPLYLSKPPVQTVVSEAALAEERARLLAAAEKAERMRRELERAEKVTPIIRPAASAASRFARMGIIEETESAVTDLDAVLRRRRAV